MASTTIENIYSEYYSTYQNGTDFMVGFYEKNLLFFKNIKQLNSTEELRMYTELISRYVEALYQKGQYSVAVDAVNNCQPFIDEEIQRLNASDEIKNDWYYNLSFIKGMANYYVRDYRTSKSIFKKLVLIDNQNDKYKNWLVSSKHAQKSTFIRVFGVGCLLLVTTVLLFEKSIPWHIGMILNKFAIIGILFVAIYEYFPHLFFRNKRK
jgi:hypothetical protein